jgi:hypothetical protein
MIQRSTPAGGIPRGVAFAIVLLAAGYAAADAIVCSRHILDVGASYGVAVDPPPIDARSPTGYADGRRSIVLPTSAADGKHWVMQTQEMIARGEWRIRRVDYDDAPHGREVHWASPFHWWLAAMAWIDHAISGRPLGISVERATLISGPAMLAVFFLGLLPFLARKFSTTAAALTASVMVSAAPLYTDFMAGRPDHHGLANMGAMFTVLFLALGTLTPPEATPAGARVSRSARRWFVASALAGAAGMWISTATIAPVLVSVGVAILVAAWFGRAAADRTAWLNDPAVFRLWGRVGGAACLAAYLVEYFPAHLALRLEVNHPLYAIAWVGGGEVLCAAVVLIARGRLSLRRRDVAGAIAGVAAVLALPVVIWCAPATFVVGDSFVWQMHTRYIGEFQGVVRALGAQPGEWLCLGAPMLLLLAPLALPRWCEVADEEKTALWLVAVPAAAAWLLGLEQVRWLGLAIALSLPIIAVACRVWEKEGGGRSRGARWRLPVAIALLFLPSAVGEVRRTWTANEFRPEDVRNLAERDVAHWLRLRGGDEPIVVAGAATPTTTLIFHGGVKGLGTLYWENAEGLKNASALFAASSPEAAEALARKLGVTHIVLYSWDAFDIVQAKLYRGLSESTPIPADLFVANLLAAPVPPPWLRAIPFKLPAHPELEGQQVRIWEVVPSQTAAQAAAHAAGYYLELGRPEIAERLAPMLAENDPLSAAVRGAIALRRQDAAAFSSALKQVVAGLPAMETLSLEDRLAVVLVLAVAQRSDLARVQLAAALRKADARSVRHLTSGAVSDLLVLCDALRVDWPDRKLQQLAQEQVPPSRRK